LTTPTSNYKKTQQIPVMNPQKSMKTTPKLISMMPQTENCLDDELFEYNDFGSQINEQLDHNLLEILNEEFDLD
jgi:hypothetical protein